MNTGFTDDFTSILKKYEKQKENTYKILELCGTDYTFNNFGADEKNELYRTLIECGTQLHFTKTFEDGKNVYHLTGANFCRKRICPMCQFRRSEKLFVQMYNVVKSLEDEGYRFLHLVLTIPNCYGGSELIEGIRKLYTGFSKFYKYKDIQKAYKGVLRCLEISYNYENDSFHPHLHCLIAVKQSYFTDSKVYLSKEKIQELWTKAQSSNQPLQVYIRACKKWDYEGVAEVCKYSVKPLDLTKSDNDLQNLQIILTLWHTLKGFRFLQKYGVIRQMFNKLYKDSDNEYLDEIRTGDHKRIFLEWDYNHFRYKRGD